VDLRAPDVAFIVPNPHTHLRMAVLRITPESRSFKKFEENFEVGGYLQIHWR
jgi:hypothetical protein